MVKWLSNPLSSFYVNRGIAKEYLGLPYCNDYKKACKLDKESGACASGFL